MIFIDIYQGVKFPDGRSRLAVAKLPASVTRDAAIALGAKDSENRAVVFEQNIAQLTLAEVVITCGGVRQQQHEVTPCRGARAGRLRGRQPPARETCCGGDTGAHLWRHFRGRDLPGRFPGPGSRCETLG